MGYTPGLNLNDQGAFDMSTKRSNKAMTKNTVLVLRNNETAGLVSMTEAIQLIKEAYTDLGHNRAQVLNRRRLHIPLDSDGTPNAAPTWFQLNVIPGAVLCHGVAALRVNARYVSFPF